jgi:hypothetical protein
MLHRTRIETPPSTVCGKGGASGLGEDVAVPNTKAAVTHAERMEADVMIDILSLLNDFLYSLLYK